MSFLLAEQLPADHQRAAGQGARLGKLVPSRARLGRATAAAEEQRAAARYHGRQAPLGTPRRLRDFDEADHQFQEQARREDAQRQGHDWSPRPYRGSLYLSWARLFVDGRFTYATLSMAVGYWYANSAAEELIEQRIPHRLVPGADHGKPAGGGWEWDLRVEANGEEGVLGELQRRVWANQSARFDALQAAYDASNIRGVYLLDESEPSEANLHVVVTNAAALSAVRFRSLLRDCRAIERPPAELFQTLGKERAALAHFVEEQHAEIKRTYDPKVTRLIRRPKIRVMKGAFDP